MGDLAPQRPMEQQDDACYVALTLDDIDVTATMDRVRSNQAGAIVLFAGEYEQLALKLTGLMHNLKVLPVITSLADLSPNLNTPPMWLWPVKPCSRCASPSRENTL